MRLPPEAYIHKNNYSTHQLDSAIDDYDTHRDARHRTPDTAQKHVKDYGLAEFYGWSEDKARQMSKAERAGVGDFARSVGFSLS